MVNIFALSPISQCGITLLSTSSIPQYLRCVLCKDFFLDPYEMLCCNTLACESCIKRQGKKCMNCGKIVSGTIEATIAGRMIGEAKAKCTCGCKMTGTFSYIRDHCKSKQRLCSCGGFSGNKEGLLKHIRRAHLGALEELGLMKRGKKNFGVEKEDSKEIKKEEDKGGDEIMLRSRLNRNGELAQLGTNGKYYCGKKLDIVACLCCDGSCGPTNGCNCSSCMKLDKEIRQLRDPRFLVNADGVITKFSKSLNLFACGRKMIADDTMPRCGYKGMVCQACSRINKYKERYCTKIG